MNVFEIKKGYFRIYDGKTAYNYHVDQNHDYSKLREPDVWYWYAKRQGMTGEETIDLMLKMLHVRRIVKVRWLRGLSLCVALIGSRGSGKSVGAAQIACVDGLLAGRRVVSNMPIRIKVKYRDCEKVLETDDLDAAMMLDINEFNDNYQDCMIVVDETNLAIADSQRSTSNQALFFSYILQQMRHRKLDFIFATQSESFQTNRVRFQTDIYIACRDMAMISQNGEFINPDVSALGRKSEWRLYDMSGLIMGEVLKAEDMRTNQVKWYDKKVVWNVPFWNCYSTELMQQRRKLNLKQQNGEKDLDYDNEYLEQLVRRYKSPVKMVLNVINMGVDRMSKSDVWSALGIAKDRAMQTTIGTLLTNLGCQTVGGARGKDYIFPARDEIMSKLSGLGMYIEEAG